MIHEITCESTIFTYIVLGTIGLYIKKKNLVKVENFSRPSLNKKLAVVFSVLALTSVVSMQIVTVIPLICFLIHMTITCALLQIDKKHPDRNYWTTKRTDEYADFSLDVYWFLTSTVELICAMITLVWI